VRDGIHMMCCEEVIMRELEFKQTTRKSIARTIALAMRSYEDEEGKIDWPKIGKACIEKWSPSGYEYILKLAWSGKCFEN
jgi:hypothetical protein